MEKYPTESQDLRRVVVLLLLMMMMMVQWHILVHSNLSVWPWSVLRWI
jgi:hypothetical protein